MTGRHGLAIVVPMSSGPRVGAAGAPTPAATGRAALVARWRRPVLGVLLTVATVAAVVVFWRSIAGWFTTLAGAEWRWALLAVLAQLVSMQALVAQQRLLLRAGGGTGPFGSLTVTVYGANAIAVGLPLAGSAASIAYTFRRMRDLGNSSVLVSWTLAVSGVCSTISLAAVVAVGSAFTGSAIGATIASLASIAVVIPVLVLLAVTRSAEAKHLVVRLVQHLLAPFARWSRSLRPEVVVPAVEGVLTAVGAIRPGAGKAVGAAALALANWVLDAVCLALALQAVGVQVPWPGVVLAWAAGALVSSTRLTPGGIGVVEAALASALVAAGLPASQAVPAVVVYRLISLWLLAALGALCLVLGPRPSHEPE